MKALRKTTPGEGAEVVSIPEPEPEEGEVLIKVEASSICGTDLNIYHWGDWAEANMTPPTTFGHEYTGKVVGIGDGVTNLKEGDRIAVESHVYCDNCYQCRNGMRHLCANLELMGIHRDGGFAEYAVVPSQCAWKTSDDLTPEERTVHEPAGNSVYATRVEDVEDKTVVVFGCGPTGLFAVGVAVASGARHVVAVENSEYRKELSQEMGADSVFDGRNPDLIPQIRSAIGCEDGADVVLEMSGHPVAYENALEILRPGSRLTMFGLPGQDLTLNVADNIIQKGARVYGIFGRRIFETWETTDELITSGRLDVNRVITHSFDLEDFQEAFDLMISDGKECGKIVLFP